jgi:hypothetical protein
VEISDEELEEKTKIKKIIKTPIQAKGNIFKKHEKISGRRSYINSMQNTSRMTLNKKKI